MTREGLESFSKRFGPLFKPRLNSSQLYTLQLGHAIDLDERLYDLQETADRLDYILVQHNDALDGIAHNQSTLHNQLIEIQSSLTKQTQKVDDLFRE